MKGGAIEFLTKPVGDQELLDAIDSFIPLPTREVDKPFLMCIEDVFNIEGRGTVVTGRVERGELNRMTEVEIVVQDRDVREDFESGVAHGNQTLMIPPSRCGPSIQWLFRIRRR